MVAPGHHVIAIPQPRAARLGIRLIGAALPETGSTAFEDRVHKCIAQAVAGVRFLPWPDIIRSDQHFPTADRLFMDIIGNAGSQVRPGVAAICPGGLGVDDHTFLGQGYHPAGDGDRIAADHAVQVTDLAGLHVDRLPVTEVQVIELVKAGHDRCKVQGVAGRCRVGLMPVGLQHFANLEMDLLGRVAARKPVFG